MKIDFSAWLAVEPGSGEIVAIFRYREDRDQFNHDHGTLTPEENREMKAYGGVLRTKDGFPCDQWGRTR